MYIFELMIASSSMQSFIFWGIHMKRNLFLFGVLFALTSTSVLSACGNSSGNTYKIIIAGMTANEERRRSIDFTDPYYQSELVLVCQNDQSIDFDHVYNHEELETLLDGKILVSQRGTITYTMIEEIFVPEFNCIAANAVDSFTTASILVSNNQAFAFTSELPVALSYVNGSDGKLNILHIENEIWGEVDLPDLIVSIGIKNGNDAFWANLNSALNEISTSTRVDIMEKMVNFNANNDEPTDNIRDKYTGSNGKIIVGLECNYPSFNWTETSENNYTYKINGKSKEFAEGYDVEIAYLLAKSLDMTLEFEKMEWDALLSWANL